MPGQLPVRHESAPAPYAAGIHGSPPHPFMLPQHVLIEGFAVMIVIPVSHLNLLQLFDHPVRHVAFRIIVVVLLRTQPEEHVAPHDGPESVLPADSAHPLQVPVHQIEAVRVSVPEQILPEPDPVGLVHADQNPPGGEAGRQRPDHRIQEGVGFLAVDQQDIRLILDCPGRRPLQVLGHMRQCLDARNHLDPQRRGVPVQLLKLLPGIPAPQISEIGIFRNLIRVLRIQHQHVQSQRRLPVHPLLDGRHGHHLVPAHIQHRAAMGEMPLLPEMQASLFLPDRPAQQEKPSAQGGCVLRRNAGIPAVPVHLQPRSLRGPDFAGDFYPGHLLDHRFPFRDFSLLKHHLHFPSSIIQNSL